jgi:preprotein translocase subunit SecG
MAILSTVLLVLFVIVAILLVLMVLIQNEEGDSLGGIFAGGSGSAFGSRSGNVLTRTTTVLGAIFLIMSLGLALLNRTPAGSGVEEEASKLYGDIEIGDWVDAELYPQGSGIDDSADDALENETVSDDGVSDDDGSSADGEAGINPLETDAVQ